MSSSSMNINVVESYKQAYENKENDHDGYVSATKQLFKEFLNTNIPVFERPNIGAVKTSRELLLDFLTRINPFLLNMSAPVMGSLLSYIINPTEENKPNDIDIWIPCHSTTTSHEFYNYLIANKWISAGYVYIANSELAEKMSPDISSVHSFYSLEYEFKIQLIYLKNGLTTDYVKDRFDFEASKGVYSPFIHKDGKPIGFRATKPEVIDAIRKMTTTYCEHEWDIVKTGGKRTLDSKSINRLKKYHNKGYVIVASPESSFTTDELYEFINSETKIINEYSGYYERSTNTLRFDEKYVMANLLFGARYRCYRIREIIVRTGSDLTSIEETYGINVETYRKKINDFVTESFFELVAHAVNCYESYKHGDETFYFKDSDMPPSKVYDRDNRKNRENQQALLRQVYTEECY